MSRNVIFINGNLGNDVEIKSIGEDKKVCNFSIAESVPTSKKDENGKIIYKTRWHNVVAWGYLAQKMADFSIKGLPVVVSGSLEYDEEKIGDRTVKHAKVIAETIDLYAIFNTTVAKESKNTNHVIPEEAWAPGLR